MNIKDTKIYYEISANEENQKVYDILKKKLKISRRLIIVLKKENGILLNGTPVFTDKIVSKGDIISINLTEKNSSQNITPENIPIEIVYEDEHILVVNKPRKMAVHPTLNYENKTLANAVMYYFKDTSFVFRPVNRLDKDTSGLIIIAKNKFSAERLSSQLSQNKIEKIYTAITVNTPSPLSGTIEAPISRADDSIIKRCIAESGSNSATKYKVLDSINNKSLVEICPLTGRTHQIRVHMAHIGCPLYADFLYGEEVENETFYLHCSSLTFVHPATFKPLTVNCPLPEYFKLN